MQPTKNSLGSIPIITALRKAQAIKETFVRRKSFLEYRSFIDRLEFYLQEVGKEQLTLEEFTQREAVLYLDHVLLHRKINALTYNNYKRVFRALFYVLIEREYIKVNPFANIKNLKETQKKRKTFAEHEKTIITQYLKEYDKPLLLAVCLCYYCAIRPAELRRLKTGNINTRLGLIFMDGSQTKNKEVATITIPALLLPLIESYNLESFPEGWYVFGKKTLLPDADVSGRDTISKRHKKAIKELHEYGYLKDITGKTFYSWKDTAAKDLIEEGLNILELKQHFRHKEIKTTQRYLQMYNGVNPSIRDMKSKIF